jgi:hypothetical protein
VELKDRFPVLLGKIMGEARDMADLITGAKSFIPNQALRRQ